MELAILEAENVSELADVSDYRVSVRQIADMAGLASFNAGFKLSGHHRNQGAWRLVRDALNQLLHDTPEGHEWPRWRRKAKFDARPQLQIDRKELIANAFNGFERTFEGLADQPKAGMPDAIEDDFVDKLLGLEGVISRDADLEFFGEPAKPSVTSLSDWLRSHQPVGFAGKTVLQLMEEGRVSEVLDYLDATDARVFS